MAKLPEEVERIIQNASVIEIVSDNPRRPIVSSTEMNYLYQQDDCGARLIRRLRTRRRTSTVTVAASSSSPCPPTPPSTKAPLSPQKTTKGILRRRLLDRWESSSTSISSMLSLNNFMMSSSGDSREGSNDNSSQGPRIPVRRVSDETNKKDSEPSGNPTDVGANPKCSSNAGPTSGSSAVPAPANACQKRAGGRRGSALENMDRRGSALDRRGSSTLDRRGSGVRDRSRRGSVLCGDGGDAGERRVSVLQKVLSASEVIGRVIDELRLYDSDEDNEEDCCLHEGDELAEDDEDEETSPPKLGILTAGVSAVELER